MKTDSYASYEDAFHKDWQDNLNGLLNSSLQGILFYDPAEDRVFDHNPRAAAQTGYPQAELTGMKGRNLFGETGSSLLQDIFARMLASDPDMIWGQPLSLRHKNGKVGEYMCSLYPVPKAPGRNPPMAMCLALDSDTPEVATADLVRKLALESLRDHLWEYDVATGILTCSRRFREILNMNGDSPDKEWSMEEWGKAIHPDDAEEVFRNWRRFLTDGVRYRDQYRIRFNDGGWYWLLSFPHAVMNDSAGKLAKVFGIHLDITDVMQRERQLADTEEQLNMIFENAGIGIAVADTDASLLKVNPALAIMLGLNREALEGKRLPMFVHPDDRAEVHSRLGRLREGNRGIMLSAKRFVRSNGEVLFVNLTATLSDKTRDGRHSIVLMFDDVTEQQNREEKLRYNATHDAMTGAWRRWVFLEALGQQVGIVNRHPEQPMAFCICDLDHFKRVNDRYGHQMGDKVLVEFVEILKKCARDVDMICRYGGEEFAVLFPNTAGAGAGAAMERARTALRETNFSSPLGSSFRTSATFGIAEAFAGCSPACVIANADAALYEGKRQGRDRVVVYGQEQ